MFNSIRVQKTLILNCVLAVLFSWIFLGVSAMADDIYGNLPDLGWKNLTKNFLRT